jgi:hypothetical protein
MWMSNETTLPAFRASGRGSQYAAIAPRGAERSAPSVAHVQELLCRRERGWPQA